MLGYKLTDKNDCTRGPTQWGPGVTHTASGKDNLCGPGWIHLYAHPLLAVLHDPIHGNFGDSAHLWEVEYDGEVKRDGQMKFGATQVTTIRCINIPVVTTEQRIRYAILCAKAVYGGRKWNNWADRWMSGEDRSVAEAAAAAAAEAEAAVAWAAYAAAAACAAAWAAADAACAAAWAAAAWAAEAARADVPSFNLITIAEEACKCSATN